MQKISKDTPLPFDASRTSISENITSLLPLLDNSSRDIKTFAITQLSLLQELQTLMPDAAIQWYNEDGLIFFQAK